MQNGHFIKVTSSHETVLDQLQYTLIYVKPTNVMVHLISPEKSTSYARCQRAYNSERLFNSTSKTRDIKTWLKCVCFLMFLFNLWRFCKLNHDTFSILVQYNGIFVHET